MHTNFDEKFKIYATCVSNDFLDCYMAEANGDYVKVYLYMLRHQNDSFSVKDIADAMNLTDNDIIRAVRYWEKKGVLLEGASEAVSEEIITERRFRKSEESLKAAEEGNSKLKARIKPGSIIASTPSAFDTGNTVDNIVDAVNVDNTLYTVDVDIDVDIDNTADRDEDDIDLEDPCIKKKTSEHKYNNYNNKDNRDNTKDKIKDKYKYNDVGEILDRVKDSEEFEGVLFVAKHVLPQLPTQRHVAVLAYMYEDLSMNVDLIEFLLEYCAGLEKTAPRYLETVAIDWHQGGIRTVREAKDRIKEFETRKAVKRSSRVQRKNNQFLNIEARDIDYDSIARKKVLDRMTNVTKQCTV